MDTGSARSVIDRISPSIAGLCSAYIHKIELSPGAYRIYTPPQNIRNRQVRNSKFENIKIPPDSGNTRSYELRCHDMVYGCIISALPNGSLQVIIDPRATWLSFKSALICHTGPDFETTYFLLFLPVAFCSRWADIASTISAFFVFPVRDTSTSSA